MLKKCNWMRFINVLYVIIRMNICQHGQIFFFIKSIDKSTISIYHYTETPKEVVS